MKFNSEERATIAEAASWADLGLLFFKALARECLTQETLADFYRERVEKLEGENAQLEQMLKESDVLVGERDELKRLNDALLAAAVSDAKKEAE